jgi:hypothetical protein
MSFIEVSVDRASAAFNARAFNDRDHSGAMDVEVCGYLIDRRA